jgi:hypothetical protein
MWVQPEFGNKNSPEGTMNTTLAPIRFTEPEKLIGTLNR